MGDNVAERYVRASAPSEQKTARDRLAKRFLNIDEITSTHFDDEAIGMSRSFPYLIMVLIQSDKLSDCNSYGLFYGRCAVLV